MEGEGRCRWRETKRGRRADAYGERDKARKERDDANAELDQLREQLKTASSELVTMKTERAQLQEQLDASLGRSGGNGGETGEGSGEQAMMIQQLYLRQCRMMRRESIGLGDTFSTPDWRRQICCFEKRWLRRRVD